MEEENTTEELKINKHKFFFEIPLYTPIKESDLEKDFYNFIQGDVDAYSPSGFDTTYSISRLYLGNNNSTYNNYWAISLSCRRKGQTLEFFLYKNEDSITKVGQFLSLADLQYAEIGKKYDKIFSSSDLHDLKKAIGLMAHGAGAGSLIYLRRIFENIIWETFNNNKEVLKIPDEEFKKKRMDEKVEFLKNYLPGQLIEMKKIYGILSKGVHELTEKECLAYFPALKLSILLILDERVEKSIKEKKDIETKKAIADIAEKIK